MHYYLATYTPTHPNNNNSQLASLSEKSSLHHTKIRINLNKPISQIRIRKTNQKTLALEILALENLINRKHKL